MTDELNDNPTLFDLETQKPARIQEIREAEKRLGRARTTLERRTRAAEDMAESLSNSRRKGDAERVDYWRDRHSRKRHDVQLSELQVATLDAIIHDDEWAPKSPLNNDGQMKIRRGWGNGST